MNKTRRLVVACSVSLAAIATARLGALPASAAGADGHGARLSKKCSPASWNGYGLSASHNAVYRPGGCRLAASWAFGVPNALAPGSSVAASSVPAWRDLVGFPIGPAVAGGVVYAPNDNGRLYALDLRTGRMLWSSWGRNEIMTTPIVLASAAGSPSEVIFGVGNSNFSYSQAVRFGVAGAAVTRGTGFSALDAVSATTGRLLWSVPTSGEVMATPILAGGNVVFADGAGQVEAVNPSSGALVWRTSVGSFDSMSSLDSSGGVVIFGGTHPSRLYGISAASGKILWSTAPPGVYSSSMGDGTPAVASGIAVTQIETSTGAPGRAGSEEIAVQAATGRILWQTMLGQGAVPPRNKDANPTIVGNTVYTGSPVTSKMYALDLKTGAISWSTALPARMKAPPTVLAGRVFEPTAAGTVVALSAAAGQVLHTWQGDRGGYGPQNLVIVADTVLAGTNLGWMQAIPLRQLSGGPA